MAGNRLVSVVTALVGAGVVASLIFFNRVAGSYNYYIVGNLIGLFFVPMLTILFVFNEGPDQFGLTVGSSRRTWAVVAVLYAALLVLMVFASRWETFQQYYPLFKRYPEFSGSFAQRYPAQNPFLSAPMLMVYAEVSYGMYLLCWEFFFRGYLLFGLSRSIGWPALLVQAAAFGLLHLGKPPTEQAVSYVAGLLLGLVAMNARSILPCFALHWAASITFDLLVVAARSA